MTHHAPRSASDVSLPNSKFGDKQYHNNNDDDDEDEGEEDEEEEEEDEEEEENDSEDVIQDIKIESNWSFVVPSTVQEAIVFDKVWLVGASFYQPFINEHNNFISRLNSCIQASEWHSIYDPLLITTIGMGEWESSGATVNASETTAAVG